MEGQKYYELRLELREVTGAPDGPVTCKVTVGNTEDYLEGRSAITLILEDVSPTTILSIALEQNDVSIGGFKFSLVTLFGEKLRGKVEKWIRLKEEAGKDIRIKLAASLSTVNMETQQSQPVQEYKRKPRDVEAKCPYVDHLASGKKRNEESLEDMWKPRNYQYDSLGNNIIRVSLEPDGRFNQNLESVEIDVNNIEELDFKKLEEAGGIQLKKILKQLVESVKKQRTEAEQLAYLRNSLKLKTDERKDLQSSLEESTNGLTFEAEEKDTKLQEFQDRRREIADKLLAEQQKSRDLEQDIDNYKSKLQVVIKDNLRIQTFHKKNADSVNLGESLHKLLSESLQKETEFEARIKSQKDKMQENKFQIQTNKEKLNEDIKSISSQISEVSENHKSALEQNQELKNKVRALKVSFGEPQNYKQLLSEAKTASGVEVSRREQGHQVLQELVVQIESQTEDFKQKQKHLTAGTKAQTQNVTERDRELFAKDQQLLDLKRKLYLASNHQITLEQICCIKADLSQLIEELKRLHKVYTEGRDHILKDLDSGSEFVLKEAEKILAEARQIDPMIDGIDEKDFELDNLKGIIGEIKGRNPPYIPVKDDPLDLALSEYLNTRDKDLDIPFTREDEGVYMFGTKRIFLKLEQGNIRIRVGGGYTMIDEFIEIYTEIELENQEAVLHDSLPKLSATLTRFTNTSAGMSPQRAARIIGNTVEAISIGSPLKKIRSPHRRVSSGSAKKK